LGEKSYSFYSFLALPQDGDEWSASRPGRALPPGKGPPVPIGQEAGWAPEPVWTQRIEENPLPGIDRPVVHSAVRHYTDSATPAPKTFLVLKRFLKKLSCVKILTHNLSVYVNMYVSS
jgi:hypothetical protein